MHPGKSLFAFPAIMAADRAVSHRSQEVTFPACGVYVIESHHADDFRMEFTRHDYAKLLYAMEGQGRVVLSHRSLALRSGWMAMIPPGTRHRLEDEIPLGVYVLCLRPAILPPETGPLGACAASSHPALSRLAEHLLREMLYEQSAQHTGWENVLTGLALQLWGGWRRWSSVGGGGRKNQAMDTSSQRVASCITEMERTFYRRESLESAARRCGLGVRRFTQVFRDMTGTSWLAWLREKRIAHAKRLLRATPRSVVSICFECGFDDLSNFYRAFHRFEGTSPQRWREEAGRKGPREKSAPETRPHTN